MSVETTINHLITGDESAVPSPITESLGEHMLDEGDRVKSYIRTEVIGDDKTPDGVLGIALVIDVCISEGMFLISSYERQIFARGAEDVLTGRFYAIYPIMSDKLSQMETSLTEEHGFHEIEKEDADVSDIEEADIRDLLPDEEE